MNGLQNMINKHRDYPDSKFTEDGDLILGDWALELYHKYMEEKNNVEYDRGIRN